MERDKASARRETTAISNSMWIGRYRPAPIRESISAARPKCKSGTPGTPAPAQEKKLPRRPRHGWPPIAMAAIWDPADYGTINAGGNAPTTLADNKPGQWNTFLIRMVGEKVTIWLNEKKIVDRVALENYWDKTGAAPLPRRPDRVAASWQRVVLQELVRPRVAVLSRRFEVPRKRVHHSRPDGFGSPRTARSSMYFS